MRLTRLLLSTAVLIVASSTASAQDFQWQGRVDPSQWMEIKGINGSIRATPSSGNQIEVEAVITSRRDDPRDVRIVTLPHANGVTICAVYKAPEGKEPNECTPGSAGGSNVNINVQVEFTVRVPQGTRFVARTVNGDVSITGMTADAKGHTINGQVEIRTTGVAEASTINGSIDATMGSSQWNEPLSFSTINGSIRLDMPSDAEMDLKMSTMTGEIRSDYPITIVGSSGPRTLHGTVGRGGRSLSVTTLNGGVELRRR